SYEDEFVELLNTGADIVPLAGWKLGDDDTLPTTWFTFPDSARLLPGQRLLLFGGGIPTSLPVPAYTDDGRIGNGLSNAGDTVVLLDARGDTVDWLAGIDWSTAQSQARSPSGTGPFQPHTSLTGGLPCSPGLAPGETSTASSDTAASSVDSSTTSTSGDSTAAPSDTTTVPPTAAADSTTAPPDTTTTPPSFPADSTGTTPADTTTVAPGDSAGTPPDSTATPVDSTAASPDSTTGPGQQPASYQVVIDEILADPPAGPAGDTNRDGTRTSYEDEFVELLNTGADIVPLAGWRLGDDDTLPTTWFVFPDSARLLPGQRLLLFGGGIPTSLPVPAYTDDGRISNGLSNAGDTVVLLDARGDTVDWVVGTDWSAAQSQARSPSGTGPFQSHTSLTGGLPCSPGLAPEEAGAATTTQDTVASSAGNTGTGTDTPTDTTATALGDGATASPDTAAKPSIEGTVPSSASPAAGVSGPRRGDLRLMITEILADPPAGPAGDANGDGVTDANQDEFVELLNLGPGADLSGCRLSDDDTRNADQFRFPPGTWLGPGEYLVLFGGGSPTGIPGRCFADDGRLGNGLTNSGDQLLLLGPDQGDTLLALVFTSPSSLDRALVRSESGIFEPHDQLPGIGSFSPGRPRSCYTSFLLDPLSLRLGQPAGELLLWGKVADRWERVPSARVEWRTRDPALVAFTRDLRVQPAAVGRTVVQAWAGGRMIAEAGVEVGPALPPPNAPPRIASVPDSNVWAGGWYRYQLRAIDPEKGSLAFHLVEGPEWLSVDRLAGLIQGRAPADGPATQEVRLAVSDSGGGTTCQEYRLQVLPCPVLRIGEILPDPPPGDAGDANGDGTRATYADEFVELWNDGLTPVEVDGWRLSDGDVGESSQFRFPAGTAIPPGQCTVVFGGGDDGIGGPLRFTDDGRLGDGLGNLTDELLLIDPDGPDTLARAAYVLGRSPRQSLVWERGDTLPALHRQWPVRAWFSPGARQAAIERLALWPSQVLMVTGQELSLRVTAHCTDGSAAILDTLPHWEIGDPGIVRVAGYGQVTALDSGRTGVVARIADLSTSPCSVRVRLPLASGLRFSPSWEASSAGSGRELLFTVQAEALESLSLRWQANGTVLETRQPQVKRSVPEAAPETLQVTVCRGRECVDRRWVIRPNLPPEVAPLCDTAAVVGTPFRALLNGIDADGDALLWMLDEGPPGMVLDPRSATLRWTAADTGSYPVRVRATDGYHETVLLAAIHVRAAAGSGEVEARVWPNPFNSSTTIDFAVSGDGPVPVSLAVYDATGRLTRVLLTGPFAPGRHQARWDGCDQAGHRVATGVYLFRLRRGEERVRSGKLVLLR
ncbi:MAG: lamin tail domain-containing protein, partial [Candidatus Latescibacterota bacterium]